MKLAHDELGGRLLIHCFAMAEVILVDVDIDLQDTVHNYEYLFA